MIVKLRLIVLHGPFGFHQLRYCWMNDDQREKRELGRLNYLTHNIMYEVYINKKNNLTRENYKNSLETVVFVYSEERNYLDWELYLG